MTRLVILLECVISQATELEWAEARRSVDQYPLFSEVSDNTYTAIDTGLTK